MDELKQQDEERRLNQETSAAGKSVSNVDPRSWEDDEPEIPEESRPNLTDLFEGADNSLFASANASMKNDNGKFDMAFDGINGTVSFTAVPEPATYAALFGLFALGFIAYRNRR